MSGQDFDIRARREAGDYATIRHWIELLNARRSATSSLGRVCAFRLTGASRPLCDIEWSELHARKLSSGAGLKRSDPIQRGTVALAHSSSGTGLLIATKSRLYFPIA